MTVERAELSEKRHSEAFYFNVILRLFTEESKSTRSFYQEILRGVYPELVEGFRMTLMPSALLASKRTISPQLLSTSAFSPISISAFSTSAPQPFSSK